MQIEIALSDFDFELPESKIAKFPVEPRDSSKLMVFNGLEIHHDHFINVSNWLPDTGLLIFNDTKVIPARLVLHRSSGARIEVLLLEAASSSDNESFLRQKGSACWKAMIGNLKKWKEDEILSLIFEGGKLEVSIAHREKQWVNLCWDVDISLSELLEKIGKIPLPPYLNREAEEMDKTLYQTIYAKHQGAVAAPTAGLHFTDQVMQLIKQKGLRTAYTTLHVGAGTFQPVKTNDPTLHQMHNEQVIMSLDLIETLKNHHEPIILVGTTSMRSIESAYQFGCKLEVEELQHFFVGQFDWKKYPQIERNRAFSNVYNWLIKRGLQVLRGETEIMILPGYQFGASNALITNFHLPATTLILLVAAFVGHNWRMIYENALNANYRFLSYGDSSLLYPFKS